MQSIAFSIWRASPLVATLLLSNTVVHAEDSETAYRFPREQRDLELREFAEGFRFGIQVGASAFQQRQSGSKEKDSSIDGLDTEFSYEFNDRLSAQALVNYEFDGSKRVLFEETFIHLQLFEDENREWFLEAGRMEMPFGEYNSNFIEDPLAQVIGETYDGGAVIGFEGSSLEIVAAGFKGDFEKLNVLAAINATINENLDTGIYWSGNIGESLELRSMQFERFSDSEGDLPFAQKSIPGMGAFIAWQKGSFIFDLELITALGSFDAGLLDDDPRRPRAWNLEFAYNPWERWQFATRLENSKHLPDSPKWQYGLAVSYGFTENFIITGNYLRAEYREAPSKRNLIQIELIFEF